MKVDKAGFRAFDKRHRQKNEDKQEVTNHNVIVLRQAAVKCNWLVKDSKWDTYLTWIQADVDELNAVIESARQKMEDPATVNHDDLMKAKSVLLEAKAMRQALNIAISYPTQIIKDGKDLKDREKDLNLEEE